MSKRPDQYSIKFGLSATVEPNTLRSLFVILVATVFENVVAFLFMKTLLITLTELILRKGYTLPTAPFSHHYLLLRVATY